MSFDYKTTTGRFLCPLNSGYSYALKLSVLGFWKIQGHHDHVQDRSFFKQSGPCPVRMGVDIDFSRDFFGEKKLMGYQVLVPEWSAVKL